MPKPFIKPRQILMSKRANIFYLEHVRIMQKNDRVVYLTQTDSDVEFFYNVPERNTIFLLLGKGTSITDAAARRLAESNVIFAFVGNGGSPLFSAVDYVFLASQSEYRPTEYMQAWVKLWLEENKRLSGAKIFVLERFLWTKQSFSKNEELVKKKVAISDSMIEKFKIKVEKASTTNELMAVEAEWARNIYALLASAFQLQNFKREEGKQSKETLEDLANSFIDHGNYIAYGYSAAILHVLGISFAFALLHGKTRRGALVFDVADLFKDAVILPLAFASAAEYKRDQQFRDDLIDACIEAEIMDRCIDTIKHVVSLSGSNISDLEL